jgi:hypothetical protein
MNLTTELRRITKSGTRSHGVLDRRHRPGPRQALLRRFGRGRPATGPLAKLKALAGRIRRTKLR